MKIGILKKGLEDSRDPADHKILEDRFEHADHKNDIRDKFLRRLATNPRDAYRKDNLGGFSWFSKKPEEIEKTKVNTLFPTNEDLVKCFKEALSLQYEIKDDIEKAKAEREGLDLDAFQVANGTEYTKDGKKIGINYRKRAV